MNLNDQVTKSIEYIFGQFHQSLQTTEETQLNSIPFEDSWTIGQTADHIIICSSGIPDEHTQVSERSFDQYIAVLKGMFLNMDLKFKADPSLLPRKKLYTKNELLTEIDVNRSNLLKSIESTDLTVICTDMAFPQVGYLTRYEWLSFIGYHTQRHLIQIENIKDKLNS
ncbi:DinB family protein [Sphingobacterium spiritivorum]|uniref:DinB family protein n=1 Tax=Sphingobacterium TaxID=28453 RepID=UPI0025F69070|nr:MULTISPECIES: DinB family protein [unclassified Sphingobacterium]